MPRSKPSLLGTRMAKKLEEQGFDVEAPGKKKRKSWGTSGKDSQPKAHLGDGLGRVVFDGPVSSQPLAKPPEGEYGG